MTVFLEILAYDNEEFSAPIRHIKAWNHETFIKDHIVERVPKRNLPLFISWILTPGFERLLKGE
jgi:hypothetical protein